LPAVRAGDIDAIMNFAQLFEEERPGVNGKPADAVEIYRVLARDRDLAEARRRLAVMALQGRGMPRDLDKAQAWLLTDAERGDIDSQSMLGAGLLNGEFGKIDRVAGERWLSKAIAAGSLDAKVRYATWLIRRSGDAQSRSRGRALIAEAETAGHFGARNNLAWERCVSPHDDLRDPAAGLVVAKRMESDIDIIDPGAVDTIAACYAAAGDYARAVELQQRVIAELPRNEKGEPQGSAGMFRRLDLYKARKPYIEESSGENQD
jgi:TPR repeat protein